MGRSLYISGVILFLLIARAYTQSVFLVSVPAEIKMVGTQPYMYYNHHCYLTYNPNNSEFNVFLNMDYLVLEGQNPMPAQEISFGESLTDSSFMRFTGSIPPSTIRPDSNPKDNYTFTINGHLDYKGNSYLTQLVCSYGAKMISNNQLIYLNINLNLDKMDTPLQFPGVAGPVDVIRIEWVDALVNKIQY